MELVKNFTSVYPRDSVVLDRSLSRIHHDAFLTSLTPPPRGEFGFRQMNC